MPTPITKLLDLSGKTALVTGATGGIGQGIASRLAEAGANVLVHTRTNLEKAQTICQSLENRGGQAMPVQADLQHETEIEMLVKGLAKQNKMPRLLVNNAAVQPISGLDELPSQEWDQVFNANLRGAFLLTRAICNRQAAANTPTAVVNIASIEALDPAKGHTHYAAAKAGLIMFTKAAALEYEGKPVRINAVSPGLIDREGLKDNWPEGYASWQSNAPLQRLGAPEDIANAVLFLLSSASSWITGANLVVDGGMSVSNRW